jgi:hypothetical protein
VHFQPERLGKAPGTPIIGQKPACIFLYRQSNRLCFTSINLVVNPFLRLYSNRFPQTKNPDSIREQNTGSIMSEFVFNDGWNENIPRLPQEFKRTGSTQMQQRPCIANNDTAHFFSPLCFIAQATSSN